jgi:spore coat protein CotH
MNPELTSQSQVDPIKNDFNTLTNLISAPQFPNNNYSDFFDIDAFANFMIVSMLTDNGELNHPKSTFIHKTTTGKYSMGPVWDFDWAYGYEGTQIHFIKSNNPIFWNSNPIGKQFFSQLIKDPKSKALIKQKWANYKANHFNNLMKYIDEYAFLISDARQLDFEKWKRGNFNYKTDVENLKTWLQNRSEYITSYVNTL